MADLLDVADTQIEYQLQNALSTCKKKVPSSEPTGYCWFCEDEIEEPKRWCCPDCRDKWERKNMM